MLFTNKWKNIETYWNLSWKNIRFNYVHTLRRRKVPLSGPKLWFGFDRFVNFSSFEKQGVNFNIYVFCFILFLKFLQQKVNNFFNKARIFHMIQISYLIYIHLLDKHFCLYLIARNLTSPISNLQSPISNLQSPISNRPFNFRLFWKRMF